MGGWESASATTFTVAFIPSAHLKKRYTVGARSAAHARLETERPRPNAGLRLGPGGATWLGDPWLGVPHRGAQDDRGRRPHGGEGRDANRLGLRRLLVQAGLVDIDRRLECGLGICDLLPLVVDLLLDIGKLFLQKLERASMFFRDVLATLEVVL